MANYLSQGSEYEEYSCHVLNVSSLLGYYFQAYYPWMALLFKIPFEVGKVGM